MVKSVSRNYPCQVCKSTHGCSFCEDGLLFCRHQKDNVAGFRKLGVCQKNSEWTMYRFDTDPLIQGLFFPFRPSSEPEIDWETLASSYQRQLTSPRREQLAKSLQLPVEALEALPRSGYCEKQGCFIFPEMDPKGKVIGLFMRWATGNKRVMNGSKRGLIIPLGWQDRPGPVRIVEGVSDTLALSFWGMPCIGRPSAMAGSTMLIELLSGIDRDVVVVGENDRKEDGSWPGKTGAEFISKKLNAAGIHASVKFPPANYKDARDWVISQLKRKDHALCHR